MSTPESGSTPPLDEVKDKLDEIHSRHASRIRWRIGKHTAELAIAALQPKSPRPKKPKKRSRRKRLL